MSQPSDHSGASRGSFGTYISGFVLSLGLTGTAFWLVHKHVSSKHGFPSDKFMFWALAALALVQLFVQLIFFLHLDRESKPRWNAIVLGFAATVVVIVVAGSIWIMVNLNYHHPKGPNQHLSPYQLNQSIIKDEGVQP